MQTAYSRNISLPMMQGEFAVSDIGYSIPSTNPEATLRAAQLPDSSYDTRGSSPFVNLGSVGKSQRKATWVGRLNPIVVEPG